MNATSAPVTITLPAAPSLFQVMNIKKIDSTANAVTISGNGANVEGQASLAFELAGMSIEIQFDGTAWWVI